MSAKINIHIFSESEDISSITYQLADLPLMAFDLVIERTNNYIIHQNDIAIFNIHNLQTSLFDTLQNIKSLDKAVIVIITKNEAILISAFAKLGFTNLFIFPEEKERFGQFVAKHIEKYTIQIMASQNIASSENEGLIAGIIGNIPGSDSLIAAAKTASFNPSVNVLLLGETGTGKSVLAMAIHNTGLKADRPFIEINCTAIPETLLESELFGHERGSFTDAKIKKIGLFEIAEDGTIFLDEIGDLSMALQAKLLKVIEKKVIRRVGGLQDIPVKARIIAATNKNLQQLIKDNLFRLDLFYRLNTITIELAPLRTRKQDIIEFTKEFTVEFCTTYNKNIKLISDEVFSFVSGYQWPGNIRELRNVIERAVLLCKDSYLSKEYFENTVSELSQFSNNSNEVSTETRHTELIMPQNGHIIMDLDFENVDIEKLEYLYAKKIFEKTSGNKTKTAKILGISRPRLDRILARE